MGRSDISIRECAALSDLSVKKVRAAMRADRNSRARIDMAGRRNDLPPPRQFAARLVRPTRTTLRPLVAAMRALQAATAGNVPRGVPAVRASVLAAVLRDVAMLSLRAERAVSHRRVVRPMAAVRADVSAVVLGNQLMGRACLDRADIPVPIPARECLVPAVGTDIPCHRGLSGWAAPLCSKSSAPRVVLDSDRAGSSSRGARYWAARERYSP